ncbi:MAG TPA: homoserine O-acetyltransferase [Thermomicrobiales bacterium]|nr:homoserine O-acetyltransferase [Thermomicrobiales bacterium]
MSAHHNRWVPSASTRYEIVAAHDDPFVTESGAVIPNMTLAYETWGTLSPERDNVVLVFHALTGDAHAASHPEVPGDRQGWWEPLIGSGRPIDTDHHFVVCANAPGSCYGSTGPRSLGTDGKRYNLRLPMLTVRDLVEAQLRLIDRLGIERLQCAIGGSLGGMQVLELAASAPERVERAVVVAASSRFHAQGIAYNELQRRAIMLDPRWRGGEYSDEDAPESGIALARMAGMITFQSDESMTMRFDRSSDARYTAWPEFQGYYDIEGYLHYQGDKLASRFDANSYLYLTRAMDSHDIGRGRGGELPASARISAETLLIGVRTDILFPPRHVEMSANAILKTGGTARYWELDSPHGHDAFLKEFERLDDILREGIGLAQSPARVAAD